MNRSYKGICLVIVGVYRFKCINSNVKNNKYNKNIGEYFNLVDHVGTNIKEVLEDE